MQEFSWGNDCLTLYFQWSDDAAVSMARLVAGGTDIRFAHNLPLVEILTAGTGHWIANDRLTSTTVGRDMRYVSHAVDGPVRGSTDCGLSRLAIVMENPQAHLRSTMTFELPQHTAMFRTCVMVENMGDDPITLESVTSWTSEFGAPEGRCADMGAWSVQEARYDWLGEGRWDVTPVRELLPRLSQQLTGHNPRGEYAVISTGTWSTGKNVPLGLVQSQDFAVTWLFQIEHNGAWRWEIGDDTSDGYMALSDPTSVNHGWSKTLAAGESFTTVPASITAGDSFETAYASLVAYRRAMRYQHEDNAKPRVIFNDYMNTINGDPYG